MRVIIGGALVALGLFGSARAQEQEQFASFARIGGHFVALQTVAPDASGPLPSFRFIRVRAEESTGDIAPSVRKAATSPGVPRQEAIAASPDAAPHTMTAELKPAH